MRSKKKFRHNARYVRHVAFSITARQINAWVDKAQDLLASTKRKGRKAGCITQADLIVYTTMLRRFLNRSTGLCDPAIDTLACVSGLSRSAVCEAKKRLKATGLLKWTARKHPSDNTQLTNLYYFDVPSPEAYRLPPPPIRP